MTRRRLAVVLLAGLLPWVVVTWPGGWYPLFSAGFVHLDPLTFTSLPTYHGRAGGIPPAFSNWPTAVVLYLGSLGSALFDDPDPRLTAGLLVLAGVSILLLASSLTEQRGILAIPLGTVWLWTAAVLGYADVFTGSE
jgi:uncharacterized protein (TIGR04206 family)